jgi:hypothetical protein
MDMCLISDKIERLFTTIGVEFYVFHLVWVAVCTYIYTHMKLGLTKTKMSVDSEGCFLRANTM